MAEEIEQPQEAQGVETTNLYDAIDGMKPEIPEEQPEQRPSTFTDYAITGMAPAMIYNNPELAYESWMGDDGIDLKDPQTLEIYDKADGPLKLALSQARSPEHFMRIAERYNIFQDSARAVEQDPFLVQLGMGAPPQLFNPTNILPFGAIGSVVKMGKQVNTIRNIVVGAGVGAVVGGASNLADEMMIETMGMPNDKLSAFAYGLGFGGLFGTLGAALAGPYKGSHAQNLSADGDTFMADFATDPHLNIEIEDGVVKITGLADVGQQRKSWLDSLPGIGKFLKGDITTVFQSNSAVLRAEATKFFAPTVSLKSNNGTIIPTPWNAQNEKALAKGYYNTLTSKVKDIHYKAKQAGYKGNLDAFVDDLSREYTAAIARQEKAVYDKLIVAADEVNKKNKGEVDTKHAEIDAERPVYVMPDNTKRELNDQDILDLEENRISKEEYDTSVAEIKTFNDKIDADIDATLKQMEDEGQFLMPNKKQSKEAMKEARADLEETMGSQKIEELAPWERPNAIDDKKVKLEQRPEVDRKKAKEELAEEYDQKAIAEVNEAKQKIYEEHKGEFEGPEHIKEGAEAYREYYKNMLEHGRKAGTKELADLSPNRLYRPRVWDFKKAKDLPAVDVKKTLYRALSSHPNQAGYTKDMMNASVDSMYDLLLGGAFDLENLSTTFVVPKHLPFEANLKNKKWKVDESKLGELLKDNMMDTTGAYNFKMSGRFAISKALKGEDLNDYMADLEKRLIAEGSKYTKEDLRAFARGIEDTAGTLRMNGLSDSPQWTFARNMGSYNSLRLGGGFGGNQFIELAANLMTNGLNSLIDGRFSSTWQNAGAMLYKGKAVDDQLTNSLIASGFMDTALHDTRVNRYSDAEMGLNPNFVETTLFKGQDLLMKVNGMRYFTAVMEDQAGGAIMVQLKDLGKKGKLSATETARLARWGMSHEDAKSFAKDLDKYYDPKEGRFELDKFSETNRIKFQQAIQNGVSEMVIQGDSIHLPSWMKDIGPIGKLLTQFMRFPMIAQEVLTRKGFQEEQVRFVGGIIASVSTYMALKYVREQASIAAGFTNEVDSKYDYFGPRGEEARRNAALQALNYTAPLGALSSLWNYGAIATGNPELGRDFAFDKGASALTGPTGAAIDDVFQLFTSAANGELGIEKDQMALKGLGGPLSLPVLSEGINSFIKN